MLSEYYRLSVEELHNKLLQIRQFVKNHNLTIGLFAEEILRDFLRQTLPQKVNISQGFIMGENTISPQCDIIIYDSYNYAPIFRTSTSVIVQPESVIAVIEVKTSIRGKEFMKVLKDFSIFYQLGIVNKYLFIYNSCNIKTLQSYFYYGQNKNKNNNTFDNISYGAESYDYDNYEELPNAIIGLRPSYEFYLKKDYVITNNRDMKGYSSLSFKDQTEKQISCLQEFIDDLYEKVTGRHLNLSYSIDSFNKFDGIELFDV